MVQVTVEQAEIQFADLLKKVAGGEEVIIVQNDTPLARLSHVDAVPPKRGRQPGNAKDILLYIADDFDAPLDDFKDYM